MTDELKEALELAQPFLEEVSKAVEDGAKFSYDILLRQQYVKVAQTGFGWLIFILFIALPLWWSARRIIRDVGDETERVILICTCAFGVPFLMALLISTFDAISILANPNYYVIQEVVKLLQQVGR